MFKLQEKHKNHNKHHEQYEDKEKQRKMKLRLSGSVVGISRNWHPDKL